MSQERLHGNRGAIQPVSFEKPEEVKLRIPQNLWDAFEDRCQSYGQDPHHVAAILIEEFAGKIEQFSRARSCY